MGLLISTVLLGGDDLGLGVRIIILGLFDLDEVGHDLLLVADLDLGALHDLDLQTENTSTELDGTSGRVNEIVLGLTSGDLITLSVLLGLGTLATDLTSNDNLATDSTTT